MSDPFHLTLLLQSISAPLASGGKNSETHKLALVFSSICPSLLHAALTASCRQPRYIVWDRRLVGTTLLAKLRDAAQAAGGRPLTLGLVIMVR